MGLQLIFVVETNKKCKSDWIYIKETIDRFFSYDPAHVKLSTVYMNGKGHYNKKENEIALLEAQFRCSSKENMSKVILCLDCDDYDIKTEDKDFLKKVKGYCQEKGWEFVWFCKDIERVYIGKKVPNTEKKDEATNFKAKKLIGKMDKKSLSSIVYTRNTSNILNVLKGYLEEK